MSFTITEADLQHIFEQFGSVTEIKVITDRETGQPRGFAFVTMNTIDEARRAVSELHDKEFMGRKLVVSGAKTSDVTASRPSESSE